MYTLVVTGGAGFIGSNFVRYILSKYPDYRVHVLDSLTYAGNLENLEDVSSNPNFAFTKGDIRDAKVVGELATHADAIINFAAESHVDRSIVNPGEFIQTDVAGVYTLLEAARSNKHNRFLHISTDEVYGTIAEGSYREGDPLEPNSPYSASKAGGELLVRAFNVTYGLNTIVTRGSNTFGPYQYPEKLIPLFVTNLIDGEKVPVYGDGLQVRDWLYVLDHCAGVDIALHHGEPGNVYNVGGGNERTNVDITHRILAQMNKSADFIRHVEDRPGHDRRYSISCDKLKKLGFQQTINFDERLHETVAWYQENQSWWRRIKEKQAEYQEFMKNWYAERK
ncbi:MAG: dTDP-glucose 4,6-dehydratase [Capsulimonadaceae bacterium]|nr:dTDP-glucose 4,6-dehydratase [Capsulimonadaceae bacterium]